MSAELDQETDTETGAATPIDERDVVEAEVVKDLVIQNNRLQDRVDELETQMDDVKKDYLPKTQAQVAMAQLASAITGREIPRSNDMVQSSRVILDEFERLRETVDELEDFTDSYGVGEARDPDEAWMQIVQAARNKQDNPNHSIHGTNEVALFVENLETTTGYSDRHCSNLIEQYGKEKRGCRWVAHEPASAHNKHNSTRKQLVVDLDVWGGKTA